MRPPSPKPSVNCWRCRHRLLYADEQTQHKLLRARFLRINADGAVWIQCATRGCNAWCVMPDGIAALVRAALASLDKRPVGCLPL
jgi:hypothetical protein